MAAAYTSLTSAINWSSDVLTLFVLNPNYVFSAAHSSSASLSGYVLGQTVLTGISSGAGITAPPQLTLQLTGVARYLALVKTTSSTTTNLFYFDLGERLPLPNSQLYLEWPGNIIYNGSTVFDPVPTIKYELMDKLELPWRYLAKVIMSDIDLDLRTDYGGLNSELQTYFPKFYLKTSLIPASGLTISNTSTGLLPSLVKRNTPVIPPRPSIGQDSFGVSYLYGVDVYSIVASASSGLISLSSTLSGFPKLDGTPFIVVYPTGARKVIYELDSLYDSDNKQIRVTEAGPYAIYYSCTTLISAVRDLTFNGYAPTEIKWGDKGIGLTTWIYDLGVNRLRTQLEILKIGKNWPVLQNPEYKIAAFLDGVTYTSSSVGTSTLITSAIRPMLDKYEFKVGPLELDHKLKLSTSNKIDYDYSGIQYRYGSNQNASVISLTSEQGGNYRFLITKYDTTLPAWSDKKMYVRFAQQTTVSTSFNTLPRTLRWNSTSRIAGDSEFD